MAKAKETISARISRVVRDLIRVERAPDESDGEYLERLVLTNIKTAEGRQIIVEHAKRDPLCQAVLDTSKSRLVEASA